MTKQLTTEQFITKAKEVHGDRYSYELVEYKNTRTKVCIICPEHGVFEQTPNNHLSGRGCTICGGKKKPTTEQFIVKARKAHGDRYDYSLVEYKNNKTKIKIICPEHGVFEQRPSHHLSGHGCGFCAGNIQLTTEQFIVKARKVHGDRYDYSLVDYINSNIRVKIICPDHGVFEQIPYNHLDGQGCGFCAGNIQLTTEQFIVKAKEIHGDKYSYDLVDYVDAKTKIKIICPIHGVFEQVSGSHTQCHGCPECGNIISQQEQELQSWLSQHIDITTNDRTLIAPLELDIIIPSKKIVIEYNGLYWHSEQRGKDRRYHLNKYNLCREKGYRLIQVWENEWLQKKDIVKSIILSAIGRYERKIHGRKCVIKEITPTLTKEFYNNNHIQGFQGGTHHALYHEGELVSLMTMKKYNNYYMLERFVSEKNTTVHGAFTKLLESFDKTIDVHTFTDLRYFTGNVYESNGFEYHHTTKPNYWYVIKGDVVHRRSFQKNKINNYYNKGILLCYNNNKSEYHNMMDNGYDRIWDCGNIKYIRKGCNSGNTGIKEEITSKCERCPY